MSPRLPRLVVAAALLVAGTACRDLPLQSGRPLPSTARKSASTAGRECGAGAPGAQLAALRAAVQALPSPAAHLSRTRLLPGVAAAQGAEQRGDRAAARAELRELIADVRGLRLHVPLDVQLAFARQAQCVIDALAASGS